MKKLYYLIVLALILGLVLTGCLLSNVGQVPTSEQSGVAYLTKGIPGSPDVFTLYADQDIDVGTVSVWDDCDDLYVKYETTGGWVMTETHLAVFAGLNDFPLTKKDNPQVGLFPYQCCYDEDATKWAFQNKDGNEGAECDADENPAVTLTEILYTIPLNVWEPEGGLYIAAHAKVVRPLDDCPEEVWQIGDVETYGCDGGVNLTNYANEFNWRKSEDDGTTYNIPVGNCEKGPGLGTYPPPYTDPFIVGTPFDEFPYNSNWKRKYANDFDVQWNGSLPFGGLLTISWSPFMVGHNYIKVISGSGIPSLETILVTGSQAIYEGWFMDLHPLVSNSVEIGPLPDELHTINFKQTSGGGTFWDWIRLEKPCEQEETAWADGERFTPKGNWATYFTYDYITLLTISSGDLAGPYNKDEDGQFSVKTVNPSCGYAYDHVLFNYTIEGEGICVLAINAFDYYYYDDDTDEWKWGEMPKENDGLDKVTGFFGPMPGCFPMGVNYSEETTFRINIGIIGTFPVTITLINCDNDEVLAILTEDVVVNPTP